VNGLKDNMTSRFVNTFNINQRCKIIREINHR
jgi:hypothetical protein